MVPGLRPSPSSPNAPGPHESANNSRLVIQTEFPQVPTDPCRYLQVPTDATRCQQMPAGP